MTMALEDEHQEKSWLGYKGDLWWLLFGRSFGERAPLTPASPPPPPTPTSSIHLSTQWPIGVTCPAMPLHQ